jgi:hypothetical protein
MMANFFIWCSGANKEILEKCPTERTKFVGIGATVFLTAVLASISGGYAVYFTFNSFFVSIPFGLLWGLIIFNLDRYIVSSIKKTGKFRNGLATALPRFLIAFVLAITISKPLEIKLFDGSITKKMGQNAAIYIKNAEDSFNLQRSQLDKTKSDLQTVLEEKRNSIYQNDPIYKDLHDQKVAKENTNVQLTNQVNYNTSIINKNTWNEPIVVNSQTGEKRSVKRYNQLAQNKISENKKLNAVINANRNNIGSLEDTIQSRKKDLAAQVKNIENQYASQIAGVQNQIDNLNKRWPEILAKAQSEAAADKDILSRLRALSELSSAEESVWWASVIITLLFILLECAPITVKLLAKRGPYDEILDRMEYEIYLQQQKIISDKNDEINNLMSEIHQMNKLKGEVRLKTEKAKLDAELKANETLLNEIAKKQADLASIAIDKWYKDESLKLKDNANYQYAKTKPTVRIEDKLWRATNLQEEIYYFFKNGQPNNNELIFIENGKVHKASWEYLASNKEIKIDMLDNAETYEIEDITDSSVKLRSLTNNYLELVKP